jgi:hypothetical protein
MSAGRERVQASLRLLQPRIERASPRLGRFVVRVLTTTGRIVFT